MVRTNATTSELLRSCQLRAGLTRASGSAEFVLGNPKAWLGSAYHAVLEKINQVDLQTETIETTVDRLWNEAVSEQHRYAMEHALNRRFGPPHTWPGYYLALASVRLRAREIVSRRAFSHADSRPERSARQAVLREQPLSAYDGKLVGRPDVIREGEVIDYKSGGVFEFDEDSQADVVKTSYVRQLRIYGYLANETLGWWPQRGILYPLGGKSVEVELDPAVCSQEAKEAVELLETYNAALRSAMSPKALASPSPTNCKWCPYKIVCQAFWETVSPGWSGQLDGAAIEGTVREPPRAIQGGAALAMSVENERGTEVPNRIEIAPLNPNVQPAVLTLVSGDRLRVVNLRVRPDGTLVPTQRTVIAQCDKIPTTLVAA